MQTRYYEGLIGPFAMSEKPVYKGPYKVSTGQADLQLWWWTGACWMDSGDGLGDVLDPNSAQGWYGQPAAPSTDTTGSPHASNDGL